MLFEGKISRKWLEQPHNSAAVLAISDSLTLHFTTRRAKVNGKKISGTDVDLHIEEPIERSNFNGSDYGPKFLTYAISEHRHCIFDLKKCRLRMMHESFA